MAGLPAPLDQGQHYCGAQVRCKAYSPECCSCYKAGPAFPLSLHPGHLSQWPQMVRGQKQGRYQLCTQAISRQMSVPALPPLSQITPPTRDSSIEKPGGGVGVTLLGVPLMPGLLSRMPHPMRDEANNVHPLNIHLSPVAVLKKDIFVFSSG